MTARTVAPWRLPAVLVGLATSRQRTFERLAAHRGGAGQLIALPGRRVLVTQSPAARKHVLVENAANYVKGMGQHEAGGLLGPGILTSDGDSWHRQRKAIGPHLSGRWVHTKSELIQQLADSSVAYLATSRWQLVDLEQLMARYTIACLSAVLDFTPPDADTLHHAFDVIQDEAIFQTLSLGLVPSAVRRARHRRVTTALASITGCTAEIRQELSQQFEELPPWATHAGLASLLLAGYETTSTTLSWAILHLAQDEPLQSQLRAGASIDEFIQFILAGRPPVWLITRRATGDDVVEGVRVRRGDDVAILTAAATDSHATADKARLAFGSGPRACPGTRLAYLEAATWLATALRELEFRPAPSQDRPPRARMSLSPNGGVPVYVRARQPGHSPLATPTPHEGSTIGGPRD